MYRSKTEPKRDGLSTEERWLSDDGGLIACWEAGRDMASAEHENAIKASNGELPILGWKGGIEHKINSKKYGSFKYLAMWQGLRNEDLDIDTESETAITCAKTGMTVIYTPDRNKYVTP